MLLHHSRPYHGLSKLNNQQSKPQQTTDKARHVLCRSSRRPAPHSGKSKQGRTKRTEGGSADSDDGEGMPGFDSLMEDKAYTQVSCQVPTHPAVCVH